MRLSLFSLLLTACVESPILFSDSVDLELNFQLSSTDSLHSPYVAGSSMGFYVRHRRDSKDLTGWKAFSVDEDVFRLILDYSDENGMDFTAVAISEGLAEIVVLDDDKEEVSTILVEVGMPDEVVFKAHGPLIIDRPELEGNGTPRVLVGGTSTWLARYYRDGERLYGNGTLDVAGNEGFNAWTEDSFLFEDRDWLQGIAQSAGNKSVDVFVAGEYVETASFKGVNEDAIEYIEIHGMNETYAEEGDSLALLAQAYDVNDNPIYGVEFGWEDEFGLESGLGDLYRYDYEPYTQNIVTAETKDGLSATVEIHGDGYVDSTNDIGCNTSNGSSYWLLTLIGAGFALVRKNRIRLN